MSILERVVRSRVARVSLVCGLAAFGAWSFAPYVVSDISTQAVVNAPIVRLKAAVDGTVPNLPVNGYFLDRAQNVLMVEPSSDTGEVAQLRADAELAGATLRLARRQLGELGREEAKLGARAGVFAAATTARMEHELRGAAAAVRACEAEGAERIAALSRAKRLVATGFVSSAGLERAEAAAAATDSECAARQARLDTLRVTRSAAHRGVYLADSYNDAPYAVQQADRLMLERQELEKLAADAEARQAEALRRLHEVEARTRYAVPAGMLVWSTVASPGAALRAGEPVLDLVDCRRRFVEVAMPERRAEAIRPGEPARVRLIGSNSWMEGRVTRVIGSAGRRNEDLFAATTSSLPDADEIVVEVSLPTTAPEDATPRRRCEVGRLAEVRFDRMG